jgi:hypothetical protein
MRTNGVTFADLDRFLKRLGFTKPAVKGPQVVYEHPESDTFFLLRPHRPTEKAEKAVLVLVRKTLVEKGLIEQAEFEKRFNGAPV